VQAAINASQADLPTNLLSQPTYRQVNPAERAGAHFVLDLIDADSWTIYDAASIVLQQELSQISGVGQVVISGAAFASRRESNSNPLKLIPLWRVGWRTSARRLFERERNSPKGAVDMARIVGKSIRNDQGNGAEA